MQIFSRVQIIVAQNDAVFFEQVQKYFPTREMIVDCDRLSQSTLQGFKQMRYSEEWKIFINLCDNTEEKEIMRTIKTLSREWKWLPFNSSWKMMEYEVTKKATHFFPIPKHPDVTHKGARVLVRPCQNLAVLDVEAEP
jgi:hypothetical protein